MDYFDLHSDTPYECFAQQKPFLHSGLAVSAEMGSVFSRWSHCFAVWISDDAAAPYALYRNILDDFKKKLQDAPDNLTPILTVEGGAVLEDHPERLEQLKSDGIRLLTLTWNGENRIAGGAKTTAELTPFGTSVIRKMNDLHIGCDLAHLNAKSFSQAIRLAEFPLDTHTCCRALYDHPRNLTDEQCRQIAERGGVIGLCCYPEFLGGRDVFERMYRNVAHLLDLGLEQAIAIGSDFDGAGMDDTLDSADKMPRLAGYFSFRGLSDGVIRKIFYENAEKFFVCL